MKSNIAPKLGGLILLLSILACNALAVNNSPQGGGFVRGSGAVTEADREVSNVSDVELAMQGTLYVETGDRESLRIEAEDNLLDYIQTNVVGDRLVIQNQPGFNLQNTRPISYHLTVKKLSTVAISSSGDIKVGDLQSPSLLISISSSGRLSIASLEGTSVQVKISSSGDVEILGGKVQRQSISISSSGEYRARDLASTEAEVTLTSSGKATIRVSDRLIGRLSSSGGVYFIGTPEVNVRTTSSGRPVQVNE